MAAGPFAVAEKPMAWAWREQQEGWAALVVTIHKLFWPSVRQMRHSQGANLYRVIFTSQVSRSFGHSALSAIAAVSQRNNGAHGVSGLLACHDHRFFQVLEGEETTLSNLMMRIAADPRHHGLSVVGHGPVAQRAFSNWRVYCGSENPVASADPQVSALEGLIPTNSDLRGRDPAVRQQVRAFLAGLRNLPAVASEGGQLASR